MVTNPDRDAVHFPERWKRKKHARPVEPVQAERGAAAGHVHEQAHDGFLAPGPPLSERGDIVARVIKLKHHRVGVLGVDIIIETEGDAESSVVRTDD